jgi:hypothetical protein
VKSECLLAAVLVLAAATTPGIATANESPLAEAGLDQTVTRGETVYLDGAGSSDPDGTVEGYHWTITGESGDAADTTSPACQTCERTQFQAEATGTYRVTLEVTDDDGATATDALFVTVEPGEPPTVSLSGPTRTTTGDATQFTAAVDGGAAPLDELVWKVDGDPLSRESLSDGADAKTRPVRFPTTGAHEVSVIATDEDGQRSADTQSITVTSADSPGAPDSGTDGTGSSGTAASTEPATDVLGPQIVTGEGELVADYELSSGNAGVWMRDSQRVTRGTQPRLSFTPGVHELYAAVDDGVATFPDGSRTVVADPAPELQTFDVEDKSVVPVDVHATDEFENLRSLTISVDGDVVESVTAESVRGDNNGRSLSTVQYLTNLEPGIHVVTATARDERGQTDVQVQTVTVPGPPEVVSAGFVNDEPLDQYHPRIDESRYTATYQVKVDLNGVDPESVKSDIWFDEVDWESKIQRSVSGGYLMVERQAYSKRLVDIFAGSEAYFNTEKINSAKHVRSVTPAPPEVRVAVVDPQNDDSQRLGMVLDARESFDPDRTQLDFDWYGVQGGHRETPKIALNSFDAANLEVGDKNDQTSAVESPISWFAPKLVDASLEDGGPYYPNETVKFTVTSEQFYLSKNTYEDLTAFELRTSHGKVSGSEKLEEKPGEIDDPDPEAMAKWFQWTVEVPARAFLDDDPSVASYPAKHPDVEYPIDLPEPVLYTPTLSEVRKQSTEVRYRVERPIYEVRQTTETAVRDNLLDGGYEVHRVDDEGLEYHLEKQVKLSDAVYDTESREFDNRGRRSEFLEIHPEWEEAGSVTETRSWTTTAEEWRSDRTGEGVFKGETRRELVEDGVYKTEKQFAYEDTETYETTETYRTTYTTTETYVEYEETCGPFGCFKQGTTVTDTTVHTVTRTKTVTKTRTSTETYWSTRARAPSHEYTGDRRRVTVSEPEYERQYLFEVERERTESTRVYLAENRTRVEAASYAWEHWETTKDRLSAETAAATTGIRISDITPTRQWTLKKQTDTGRMTTKHPSEDAFVVETIGTSEATLVQHYTRVDAEQTAGSHTRTESIIVRYNETGLVPETKIKDILERKMESKYGQ